MKTLYVLPQALIADEPGSKWINRIRISSETSMAVYIVSQDRDTKSWACSCPGWSMSRRRSCKHLAQLGLPAHEQPLEVRISAGGAMLAGEKLGPAPMTSTQVMGARRRMQLGGEVA